MTSRFLVIVGAAIAIGGSFCPFAMLPFLGEITYFLNGKGDGVWVIVISLVVGGMAVLNIVTPALLGSLLIGGLLFSFQGRLAAAVGHVLQSVGQGRGSLLSGLGDMVLRQVRIDWGFWVIALGAGLMFLGAILRLTERAQERLHHGPH